MSRLYVAATRYPGETRAVVHDADERPVDIRIFRGNLRSCEGAIWRGRILGSVSGAKALLVDIGGKFPGFLPFNALPSGAPQLTEGSFVTVMIDRPARADKGPRLTAKPRLSSPHLIFSPFRKGISVSRRLKGDAAARLETWAQEGVQDGEGWVVRGAASACDFSVLATERDGLRHAWKNLQHAENNVVCLRPGLDPFVEWLADFSNSVELVRISGVALIAATRELMSKDALQVDLGDAFAEAYGEDVLQEALSPMIGLPSGGQISIQPTRAFWAVDVDSNGVTGPLAAQQCNDEAISILAKQLVLRNMGGAIVVDVIPEGRGSQSQSASKRLVKALKTATQNDDRVQVYGATPMGHIELVRSRRGTALHEVVYGDTIECTDAEVETAVLAKLRAAVVRVKSGDQGALILKLSAVELGWLDGVGRHALKEAEDMLGQSLSKELIS